MTLAFNSWRSGAKDEELRSVGRGGVETADVRYRTLSSCSEEPVGSGGAHQRSRSGREHSAGNCCFSLAVKGGVFVFKTSEAYMSSFLLLLLKTVALLFPNKEFFFFFPNLIK